ncbi:MAG: hypothetical protein KDD70_08120 [Bdellovibrionales bacterium]|nr:hypothetical protein [Bdellovibrionales bacterium]
MLLRFFLMVLVLLSLDCFADEEFSDTTDYLVNQDVAEQLEQLDGALLSEEEKLLNELSGESPPRQKEMTSTPRAEGELVLTVQPQIKEKRSSLANTATKIPVATSEAVKAVIPAIPENVPTEISKDLLAQLQAQQAELDTLAAEFESLDRKSRGMEDRIDRVSETLIDTRTENLLASLQTGELREILDEDSASDEVKAKKPSEEQEGDKGEIVAEHQPIPFDLPHTNVENPLRAVRQVNANKQYGSVRIPPSMPLAQLTAPIVQFRAGPAEHFESLFRAAQGEVVAIEKRYEDWYRIIHESGVRGWVQASNLLFGPNSRELPGKIIRIKAYDIGSDTTDWEGDDEAAKVREEKTLSSCSNREEKSAAS